MPSERHIGLYRSLRRHPEKRQIVALEKHGCGRSWSWDERERALRYLRAGDVVVLPEAHCLGPTRDEVERLMVSIFEKGATLEVLNPPITASTMGAAQIAFRAVAGLAGDSKAHETQEAREYGKLAWSELKAGRTPFATMKRYWRSAEAQAITAQERMSHPAMRGWSIATVYRAFREAKNK